MKRPATHKDFSVFTYLNLRHHCGGPLEFVYDINGCFWQCTCRGHWRTDVLTAMNAAALAERFYVETPDVVDPLPRLVWVTTGKVRHTALVTDPQVGDAFGGGN